MLGDDWMYMLKILTCFTDISYMSLVFSGWITAPIVNHYQVLQASFLLVVVVDACLPVYKKWIQPQLQLRSQYTKALLS